MTIQATIQVETDTKVEATFLLDSCQSSWARSYGDVKRMWSSIDMRYTSMF